MSECPTKYSEVTKFQHELVLFAARCHALELFHYVNSYLCYLPLLLRQKKNLFYACVFHAHIAHVHARIQRSLMHL